MKYLESRRLARIDERDLEVLQHYVNGAAARAKPVSRSYLLGILADTQMEISRSLGGLPVDLRGRVHFGTAERAAESLLDLLAEYRLAQAGNDLTRAEDCRRAVRQAKDRLRSMLRRPNLSPEKRKEKEELLQWFLIWLETPEIFEQWLVLRRRGSHGPHSASGNQRL